MTCNSDVFAVKIPFPIVTFIGATEADTRAFPMCWDKACLPNNTFRDYLKRIPGRHLRTQHLSGNTMQAERGARFENDLGELGRNIYLKPYIFNV